MSKMDFSDTNYPFGEYDAGACICVGEKKDGPQPVERTARPKAREENGIRRLRGPRRRRRSSRLARLR